MSVMDIGEFQSNFQEVIKMVDETGEPVFITRDGVPIITVRSIQRKPKSLLGVMKGLFIEENVELLNEPVLKPEDLMDSRNTEQKKMGDER